MNQDPIAEYAARFKHLRQVAGQLEEYLADLLRDFPHIDRVSARAKTPESFSIKAQNALPDGEGKYAAPLQQIQDQIGARVIVFYRNDVELVAAALEKYFQPIEWKELVPDSQWEFGYFGRHWIFALPSDVVPRDLDTKIVPRFFELQVKTLYQHAWSEANHDLGYKAARELTGDQKRRLAYTSAQSWGADRVFDELRAEILAHGSEADRGNPAGELPP
jgi:ppGpp synthetase/RelA/SpoT-type nucleotidyltranferase